MKGKIRVTHSDEQFNVPEFDIELEEVRKVEALLKGEELSDEEREGLIEWVDAHNVRRVSGSRGDTGGTESISATKRQKVAGVASIQHNRVSSVAE